MSNVKCYHHNTTTTKQKHFNCLLRDEIAYHNRNFINVYQLVTKYIADVQVFKKSVFNLITSGKIDKARNSFTIRSMSSVCRDYQTIHACLACLYGK